MKVDDKMKDMDKKGFTLVELLAVIVVLAIIMSLAVFAVTNVLDNARKSTFVTDAKTFLDGAHKLVSSDDMLGLLGPSNGAGNYRPICHSSSAAVKYIPLNAINLEQGGVTSPYGNKYNKGEGSNTQASGTAPNTGSFIKIEAKPKQGASLDCDYVYSIYLTDDVYAIGTKNAPVEESTLDTSKVTVANGT